MGLGSSVGLSVLVLATGVVSLGLAGPADPTKQPIADPAVRRELAGDDAKRVEELEKKIEELRQAGNYSEAQAAMRMILEIRRRVQGMEHWQTGDAQRLLRTLEQIAALPADARVELAEATKLRGEAAKLYGQARYERALPLLQRALEIRQRHLGEEHSKVTDAMNELAELLFESGRYAEAEPLARCYHPGISPARS